MSRKGRDIGKINIEFGGWSAEIKAALRSGSVILVVVSAAFSGFSGCEKALQVHAGTMKHHKMLINGPIKPATSTTYLTHT